MTKRSEHVLITETYGYRRVSKRALASSHVAVDVNPMCSRPGVPHGTKRGLGCLGNSRWCRQSSSARLVEVVGIRVAHVDEDLRKHEIIWAKRSRYCIRDNVPAVHNSRDDYIIHKTLLVDVLDILANSLRSRFRCALLDPFKELGANFCAIDTFLAGVSVRQSGLAQ